MHPSIREISRYLPAVLADAITEAIRKNPISIQEIRLRIRQPMSIVSYGQSLFVTKEGQFTTLPTNQIITKEMLSEVFMKACNHSVYAYSRELQNGFLTLPGGFRMGIAGRIVYEKDAIHTVRDISSLSIRIAQEVKGCAQGILPHLLCHGLVRSCGIISPPGGGKTTVLRDLARGLSTRGYQVCVIDERSEIAGCRNGLPTYDLGAQCDVLDGCRKRDGLMWALRALAPSVMIVDELGSVDEAQMVLQGINGGVATVFSLHAGSLQQALLREPMQKLKEYHAPDLLVLLGNASHPGTVLAIYERKGRDDYVEMAQHSSA